MALSVALTFVGCKNKYVIGPIDDDAEKQGKLFWEKSFSKCGDSYYGAYARKGSYSTTSPWIFEFKDPFIFTYHDMDKKEITEADRLNGFEWQGITAFYPKAYRDYRDGKWSDWDNYGPSDLFGKYSTTLRKIHGRWEFGITDESDRFVAIPCPQIPQ